MARGSVQSLDTQKFEATIRALHSAVQSFSECRNNVAASTDRLNSAWLGSGADAFDRTYNRLRVRLQDEEENLRNLTQNLESLRDSYREWDERVISGS